MKETTLKKQKRSKLRRFLTLATFLVTLTMILSLSAFADTATPTVLAESDGMVGLVEEIFASFTTVIKGLTDGLKEAFSNLIYIDPAATDPKFSPLIVFSFVMAGVGLATGILYKVFGMIRAKRG